ncbi:TIGR03621 family F420-dependent LLM class oxidoreductase [Actinoallomurus sp. NBC_01490]|uniref:TIGR03621 family F420-dependent LLM class oxidoreductase n=1 Tax=Actinoallomurus sp. NBC_01490 TaxID=2903557 RepID=UPI002E360BDF|nr:TIGR03621 family F420-dependent LLM class oxidoreductase [Actinoallomurus sp. NBC_01490]
MADFRFSFDLLDVGSRERFIETCRRGEAYGYDTVFAADHLGFAAPFPALVAAAAATERLKVGTLVLNAAFWNPALLAREVVTTDVLTGGRLEVGLGSGHMKWEFDEAGIPWESFGPRADRLERVIEELGRLLAMEGYPQHAATREALGLPTFGPVQRQGFGGSGPPLIVGGTGDRVLRIAAEHADIIAVAGLYQIKGRPPGTFRLGTAEEAAERVRYARERAGDRADQVEWHVLIQLVLETDDREAAAEGLLERYGHTMTVEEILDTPFLLIGTVEQMAEQILRDRERFGFTYYTVHGPFMDAFAPVIERVRALAKPS